MDKDTEVKDGAVIPLITVEGTETSCQDNDNIPQAEGTGTNTESEDEDDDDDDEFLDAEGGLTNAYSVSDLMDELNDGEEQDSTDVAAESPDLHSSTVGDNNEVSSKDSVLSKNINEDSSGVKSASNSETKSLEKSEHEKPKSDVDIPETNQQSNSNEINSISAKGDENQVESVIPDEGVVVEDSQAKDLTSDVPPIERVESHTDKPDDLSLQVSIDECSEESTEKEDAPELKLRTLKHDYVNEQADPSTLNHDYETLARLGNQSESWTADDQINGYPPGHESIYENVDHHGSLNSADTANDDDWSSSDFESFEEGEVFNEEEVSSQSSGATSGSGILRKKDSGPPVLPARNKKSKFRRSRSSTSQDGQISASAMIDKLAARLGSRSKKDDNGDSEEEDSPVMEVEINMDKHPPPQLVEMPNNLSSLQVKRRHIIASIVDSENSYLSSLRRIVEDYEKPLLEATLTKTPTISKSAIKVIFFKVKDILQCHNMFQIELCETIKLWDEEEKIGNVFNASFSKSIVFDVYSAFVNNFSIAMETAKKLTRSKQAFADFLKMKLENAQDKLSLFGLFVKPVQRFPQFILLLQDLLKHTPQDHHDRLPLQMALTELENLTHRLNETKRESESRHDVKKILGHLTGRFSIKADDDRYLIRQDTMIQKYSVGGVPKAKSRRLFLMNDQLICASVQQKETETGIVERYKYKWSVPVTEVSVVESPVNSSYKVKVIQGKTTVTKFEKPDSPPADHPFKKELDDLLHDLPVIQEITRLVETLRFKYQTLTTDSLNSITRNLQLIIQQKTDIDQCVIHLSLPIRHLRTSTDKIRGEVSKHIKQVGKTAMDKFRGATNIVYAFQVHSPSQKQDWLLELKNAKLALDPANNPGWYLPEHKPFAAYKLPLFIRTLPIDITKQENKIQCSTPIMLPSHDQPGVGIQHLWVCSGDKNKSQITIVSLHGAQPYAVESFPFDGAVCITAERIPGSSREDALLDDTVWMTTEDRKVHIYRVLDEKRQGPMTTFSTPDMVMVLRYWNNFVFAGMYKGQLAIFTKDKENSWQYDSPEVLQLGSEPVMCILVVNQEVWVTCGNKLHIVRQVESYIADGTTHHFEQMSHQVGLPEEGSIECIVRAGVGLIVSFRNKGLIKLYHAETLSHLQDINMASVVRNYFEERETNTDLKEGLKRLAVTCLLASKGLLWIGTNIGCILSLPLPRLEGVPHIRGRPSVSHHAHTGPIKFLTPINCGVAPLRSRASSPILPSSEAHTPSDGQVFDDFQYPEYANENPVDTQGFCQSADFAVRDREIPEEPFSAGLYGNRWSSTPDLREFYRDDTVESLHALYGSLLRGLDEDIDVELQGPKARRRSKNVRSNLHAMSHRVSKLSGAMMNKIMSQDSSGYKAYTLPVLHEESGQKQNQSSPNNVNGGGPRNAARASPARITEPAILESNHDYENVEIIRQHEICGDNQADDQQVYENIEVCRDNYMRSVSAESTESDVKLPVVASIYPGMHITSHLFNKAVVVVSGGEGHINWNDKKALDSKYEDICLLLWQCRQ